MLTHNAYAFRDSDEPGEISFLFDVRHIFIFHLGTELPIVDFRSLSRTTSSNGYGIIRSKDSTNPKESGRSKNSGRPKVAASHTTRPSSTISTSNTALVTAATAASATAASATAAPATAASAAAASATAASNMVTFEHAASVPSVEANNFEGDGMIDDDDSLEKAAALSSPLRGTDLRAKKVCLIFVQP